MLDRWKDRPGRTAETIDATQYAILCNKKKKKRKKLCINNCVPSSSTTTTTTAINNDDPADISICFFFASGYYWIMLFLVPNRLFLCSEDLRDGTVFLLFLFLEALVPRQSLKSVTDSTRVRVELLGIQILAIPGIISVWTRTAFIRVSAPLRLRKASLSS